MQKYELNAVFVYNGFVVEKQLTENPTVFFDQVFLDNFVLNKYTTLLEFGILPRLSELSPTMAFMYNISRTFIECVINDPNIETTRRAPTLGRNLPLTLLAHIDHLAGKEFININWLTHIWSDLGAAFETELSKRNCTVAEYLQAVSANIRLANCISFHIVESGMDDFPFAFLATYAFNVNGIPVQLPLKRALKECHDSPTHLLKIMGPIMHVAAQSKFVHELLISGELFCPLRFSVHETQAMLKELSIYENAGIICRIPEWWHSRNNASVKLTVGLNPLEELQLDTVLAVKAHIQIGNTPISRDEADTILSQTTELSVLKGTWIAVNHKKLHAVLEVFAKVAQITQITIYEALKLQLGVNQIMPYSFMGIIEIDNGPWLNNMQSRNLAEHKLVSIEPTEDFIANLRPYQHAGFNWLFAMRKMGLGALLADDMGLGKTIQALALLDYLRVHEPVKTLLVVPASLVDNWQQEIQQFAPKLEYKLLRGGHKDLGLMLDVYFNIKDLFIVTYNMVPRILTDLQELDWDLIIIDEAQYIKNHTSQQSRALKVIPAKFKLAMSGTPLENKLSDLWSIFDFLNQGLLGSQNHFDNAVQSLRNKPDNYESLHKLINPFILRRTKSDKSIIADLPDKIEINAFAELSRQQISLYTMISDQIEEAVKNRRLSYDNFFLTVLLKLKKICNHPDHFLGHSDFNPKHSGKFMRLGEICEAIAEKNEKVIVFTQFRDMCQPLADYLSEIFGNPGLVLHGKIPVQNRIGIVQEFNSNPDIPFMVLSLKTGGVGINLTSANHVIHFDRWWNPAVENQATDRVFRIGQKKNVLVHKLITKGTIEDKINHLLMQKQKMAGDIIVANGGKWILDLSESEIINLFKLEV